MFWNGSTTNEGLSGSASAAARRRSAAQPNPKHPDLCRDILQFRLAEIVDLQRHLAGGVLAHPGGNTDATGLGQRFQPRRDDHAVTQQVVALRYYLALVDANPKAQRVGLGAQHILNGDGTAQRLHRAGEIDEEAVAGSFEQAAAMRCRERFDRRRCASARTRASVPGSSAPTMAE